MAWLKIDDNAPHHAKMLKAGPAACWLWVCGLAYCQKHSTDGFIPAEALPWLGVAGPHKLAGLLVLAGLWHAEEKGWRVHDFLEWNDSADERLDKSGKKHARQQKWREKKANERVAEASPRRDVDASTVRHGDDAPTPPPPPQPTPTPQPQPSTAEDAVEPRVPRAPSPSASAMGVETGLPPGGVVRGGLALSSAEFVRLQRFNAYVGARLRVPHKLHGDFVAQLGGEAPDAALRAWYAAVDEEIEHTREAITPDVWKWLDARFKTWLVARVGDAEMRKFLEAGRGA